jgi:hypothetical protein
MSMVRNSSLVVITAVAMTMSACHRQAKPQPLVPAPALPLSAIIPPPEVLPPGEDEEPAMTAPAEPATTVASKPKPRPRPNNRRVTDVPKPATTAASEPPPAETPAAQPPKITAQPRDVPTTAAISEGLPHSDEMHHKETAAQLNQSTEENLRSITRTLTAGEKSIVEQIRAYMAQSQEAIGDNDLVRAHNLALKAHLLSDELAHR